MLSSLVGKVALVATFIWTIGQIHLSQLSDLGLAFLSQLIVCF